MICLLVPNREAGNWLAAYLEYGSESESPDAYHVWTALSAIASVTRRRTWLDQGIFLLYNNMYIALVGPPARTAKTTAIRLGRELVQEVPGIIMGPDSVSREQLIRAMATCTVDNQSCMTIHSSEFSSILDISGIQMIQFLTDIYDCDYKNTAGWRYETKHAGHDKIMNPFLNMLVGTTPDYIADSMPANITGLGFSSRTIFVYEDRERQQNPFPDPPPQHLVDALVQDLQHISGLGGSFEWDDPDPTKFNRKDRSTWGSGHLAYSEFYDHLYSNPPTDHRLQGYHWRKKVHCLKVAMLLSLAERDELILDAQVINTAIKFLDALEASMARTFSAVGKFSLASDLERIGGQIWDAGGMLVGDVLKRNYFAASEQELRGMLLTLQGMGVIKYEKKDGREWVKPVGERKGALPWEG